MPAAEARITDGLRVLRLRLTMLAGIHLDLFLLPMQCPSKHPPGGRLCLHENLLLPCPVGLPPVLQPLSL